MEFRWIEWNVQHIEEHGVDWQEAELLIERARAPYPLRRGEDKWMVKGAGNGGRLLQAIYVVDPDGTVFVIHARPLTDREKKRFKRRRKS